MNQTNSYPTEDEFNQRLSTHIFTLNDLRIYIRFRFQDYRSAGRAAGISRGRVKQILIGYKIPKSAKLIRQIARGWGVDEIKLAQLFDGVRK
jgi:hypothetical protein